MISKADLFRQVAAGEDLACEDAMFLCQLLDPYLWVRTLERTRADQAEADASAEPSSISRQQAAE